MRIASLKPTIVPQISSRRLLIFLRRTSVFDRVALGILVLYVMFRLFALAGMRLPFTGLLFFLSFISVIYFVVRFLPWVRNHLLWRLRNRLIVAYILIAVVPVVLLLSMAALGAYGIYLQLGAHLLHDGLQQRTNMVAGDGEAIASAIEDEVNRGASLYDDAVLARPEVAVLIAAAHREWPDVRVLLNRGQHLVDSGNGSEYSGIVEFEHQIWIASAQKRSTHAGPLFVLVGAPVTPEFLDSII